MADAEAIEGLAATISSVFISPNCLDSNLEAANVVDGLYRIASAIDHLAKAVESKG